MKLAQFIANSHFSRAHVIDITEVVWHFRVNSLCDKAHNLIGAIARPERDSDWQAMSWMRRYLCVGEV